MLSNSLMSLTVEIASKKTIGCDFLYHVAKYLILQCIHTRGVT